jgi:hypothetical protein
LTGPFFVPIIGLGSRLVAVERPEQPGKVRHMKTLVKSKKYHVRVTGQEAEDLEKAVRLERRRRGDATVGAATLLRELAMPKVRELLAQAAQAA